MFSLSFPLFPSLPLSLSLLQGVSHFPCCITNFPQGWPRFAQHVFLARHDRSGMVVASLVPSSATLPGDIGGGGTITTTGMYPFVDTVTIAVTAKAALAVDVRVPGWADAATINGNPAANGTLVEVKCGAGTTTITVELNPSLRVEVGWGPHAVLKGPTSNVSIPATNGMAITRGSLVFALHPAEIVKVVATYIDDLPVRPKAVDYEISTVSQWRGVRLYGSNSTMVRLAEVRGVSK